MQQNDPPDLDSGQAAAPPEQSQFPRLAGDVDLTEVQQEMVDDAAADFERAQGLVKEGAESSAADRRRAEALNRRGVAEIEETLADAQGWQDLLSLGEAD